MTKRGCFISLEGGEGAGKSTQIRLIGSRISKMGIKVLSTREPGGSEGAEAIRSMVLSNATKWGMRTEAMLFAAARMDHVEKMILPALERGEWVLCDRYLDSSRAYQGVAGELGDEHILQLHALGAQLLPDRTIVLDVGHVEGTTRTRQRDGDVTDRIGGREAAYHARTVGAFRRYAEQDQERIRLVEANGSVDGVTDRIMAVLADLLP